jgi:hypothetical protein
MIIAIATDDGTNVAVHPDQCGGFVLFEVGGSTAARVGYRSNACIQNGEEKSVGKYPRSSGSRAFSPLVFGLSDCGAMVSQRIDDCVARELSVGGIDGYICQSGSVDEAARLFVQGRLRKLNEGMWWANHPSAAMNE